MSFESTHGLRVSDARLLAAQQRVRLEDASAPVRMAAGLLFSAWLRSADRETFVGGIVRRVVAVLQLDGFAGPALTGARGGPSSRQLVYSADSADVMISIRPDSESTWFLDGIVLPSGDQESSFDVRLERVPAAADGTAGADMTDEASYTATAQTDAQGEFRFPGVPTGRCLLAVRDRDCVISVGPFDLAGVHA